MLRKLGGFVPPLVFAAGLNKVLEYKPQTLGLENQTVKVAAPSVDQNIDATSEMTLQWCLQRRGIAFDQSRLINWSTHQTWMQQLLTTLSKDPPEGDGRVKIEQVVKADRELLP